MIFLPINSARIVKQRDTAQTRAIIKDMISKYEPPQINWRDYAKLYQMNRIALSDDHCYAKAGYSDPSCNIVS